ALAGYTGQFSLAPAAFAMLGGYTTALLEFYWHVPLAIAIPAAIVSTALLGLVLGKLVLNLSGPYLSLTTLAFAEIARVVIGTSCAICGLAGSLYGTFSQLVSPELGLLQQTGLVLAMVVIGGMGSLTGSVIGALLVYLGSEWLRGLGNVQVIVFALIVILFAR